MPLCQDNRTHALLNATYRAANRGFDEDALLSCLIRRRRNARFLKNPCLDLGMPHPQ